VSPAAVVCRGARPWGARGESDTVSVRFQVVPAGFHRFARGAAALLVAAVALSGCGSRHEEPPRDGLEADTARFTYGDRTAQVPLADCGRDGDVVVLAGIEGAVVVQAEADVGEGGFDRTGVTADLGDDGIMGAFGADMEHGPAGEITDVRVEGDRLIVEGTWVAFDEGFVPRSTPEQGIEGRLVARCPDSEDDDDVAAGVD
jgi:hypothetical protein